MISAKSLFHHLCGAGTFPAIALGRHRVRLSHCTEKPRLVLDPTWIPARPANYLVILADQHYLFYFSIGDVLIISGALLWFVGPRLLRSFTQLRMRRANISHAQEIAQADPMSPCPSQTVPT